MSDFKHILITDGCDRSWSIVNRNCYGEEANPPVWTASQWSWPDTLDNFLTGDGAGGWAEFDSFDEAKEQVRFLYGNP